MPIITQISSQVNNKNKCNVSIDGEYYCALSLETVIRNRLKVGDEITAEELTRVVEEGEKETALSKAIGYISKRIKTKREVKDYLTNKGFSENIVWYCIDKLKEYNFIDDKEYSRRYIECVSKTQGKRLSEYKLMMKGVKKEDIESAYQEVDINDNENALNIAVKHIKNKEKSKENLAKTYRYLIGRGFSYEQANYAIDKLKEEN